MTTIISPPKIEYKGFIIFCYSHYPQVFSKNNKRKLLWEALDVKSAKQWIDDLIAWLNS